MHAQDTVSFIIALVGIECIDLFTFFYTFFNYIDSEHGLEHNPNREEDAGVKRGSIIVRSKAVLL